MLSLWKHPLSLFLEFLVFLVSLVFLVFLVFLVSLVFLVLFSFLGALCGAVYLVSSKKSLGMSVKLCGST